MSCFGICGTLMGASRIRMRFLSDFYGDFLRTRIGVLWGAYGVLVVFILVPMGCPVESNSSPIGFLSDSNDLYSISSGVVMDVYRFPRVLVGFV